MQQKTNKQKANKQTKLQAKEKLTWTPSSLDPPPTPLGGSGHQQACNKIKIENMMKTNVKS